MTPTAGARRKIDVAIDLFDYIQPGDAVILLHISPTSILFDAEWGSIDLSILIKIIQGPKTQNEKTEKKVRKKKKIEKVRV